MSGRSFGSAIQLKTLATPTANPPSGSVLLYIKSDGKVYTKTSAGVEAPVDTTGAAPTNMVTTDTAQTLNTAGIKTFPPGTLLMQNAAGTVTAEPYSDANAPVSLERSIVQSGGEPPAPPTGESVEWTVDGKSLDMKAPDGTVTRIGPAAGGGGGGSGTELAATTDYSTTPPATPSTGIKVFSRFRARRVPAFIGPLGQDTPLQPGLYANRVGILGAQNGVTNLTPLGLPSPTTYTTTATAVTITPPNFYTSRVRLRYPSAATAAAFAGFRLANPTWFLSTVANNGGFFWVFRFGINAGTATGRGFFGLSATNANEANSEPTALLNRIGFGYVSGGNNFFFHSAGATTNATVTDLGVGFPAKTYATNFYEFRLFAAAGSAQVYWSAHRLNDDFVVTGGPVTTNLPAVNTLLTHHSWMNNNTAAAVSFDFQSLYIETDN